MNAPLVSVIMPVFNAQTYIHQAIQSLLNQTYTNFEFLIFDDGSTDDSLAIIQSFNDPRIQVFSDGMNKGQPERYNAGVQIAKGKYIAIAHADDVVLPNHLKQQVQFLEVHMDYDLVGGRVELIDESGKRMHRLQGVVGDHNFLNIYRLFACPLLQNTILVRTGLMKKNPYNSDFSSCEDYEIYSRLFENAKLYNRSEVLVYYRQHEFNLTKTKRDSHAQRIKIIMQNQYRAIGIEYTEKDFQNHLPLFYFHQNILNIEEIKEFEQWLFNLKNRLLKLKKFDSVIIENVVSDIWYQACKKGRGNGWRLVRIFHKKKANVNFKRLFEIFLISLRYNQQINQFYTYLRRKLSNK